MLENIEIVKPELIEKRSMEIIESEMSKEALEKFTNEELLVVKRCIHTAADFDYEKNLVFHKDVINKAFALFKEKTVIITDTSMAMAGMNKNILAKLGAEVRNFIADEDVIREAKERGLTRSAICMDKAAKIKKEEACNVILAIGHAPTALIRLYELDKQGEFKPDMIVAVPVVFVYVVESKELILGMDVPAIVARGRKGGSNICAAIINAIIYQLIER